MARRYRSRSSGPTASQIERAKIVERIGDTSEYMQEFDSLGTALAYAAHGRYIPSDDLSWAGGLYIADAIHGTQRGTIVKQSTLASAMLLLDKIDASFRDRDVQTWQPSIMGAYPIVPDYLMGRIDAMRMKQQEESAVAPIKVYIECAVSAGVTHDQLIRRGTAIAALLMRMNEERPVELYMFAAWNLYTCKNHKCMWTMRLDSTPISVSQVLHCIAEPTFLRMINFSISDRLARENGDNIRWGLEAMGWAFEKDHSTSNDNARETALRERFRLEPQDIVVQRGFLPDAALMDRDPVAWVHAQLEKQRALDV